MSYIVKTNGQIFKVSTGSFIPNDPLNRDWAEYQEWLAKGNAPKPDVITDQEARSLWREERDRRVAAITVTLPSGRTFDGDEISQGRMARAIVCLRNQPGGSTVRWVLTNNEAVDVGLSELLEALTLAGLRQSELWVQT